MLKLSERNASLEKDIERVRIESECRLEEAQEDKEALHKEIKRLQDQEEAEVNIEKRQCCVLMSDVKGA